MRKSTFLLNKQSSIEVAHTGGHLCSWKCQGEEQLYLSPTVLEGKAIRGGVPVIFPQFETFGDGPRHGFARTAEWLCEKTDTGLKVILTGRDNSWPYHTSVQLQFLLLEKSLKLIFSVKNNDPQRVQFTCALHSYFKVNDIRKTQLTGLKGLDYWTHAEDFSVRKNERHDMLTFNEKIDRIYFNTRENLKLTDSSRTLVLESSGFEDTVVWNPGLSDAKQMPDLPDEDYLKMLCIEPARVNNPVILEPGQHWQGMHHIMLL